MAAACRSNDCQLPAKAAASVRPETPSITTSDAEA